MTDTAWQVPAADDHDAVAPQHLHEAHVEVAATSHHHDAAEPDPAPVLKAHGTMGRVGKGSCTPCASCCVVAALPATMVVFEAIPMADFFVPLAARGAVSFLTESPERPPRSILV